MRKSKIFVVALIGLLLAGGLVLVSCGDKCPENGACYYPGINNGGVSNARLCKYGNCRANEVVNSIYTGKCDCDN